MTLYIDEAALSVELYFNQPNLTAAAGNYTFVLKSQYSKQDLTLTGAVTETNDRYSTVSVTFPTGFGDEHKNGIYYWSLISPFAEVIEKGLAKVITEPGGSTGMTNYTSNPATEEREADVYYRPNY